MGLIYSAIGSFVLLNASANKAERNTDDSSTVRINLPFTEQVDDNMVLKRLCDINHKIRPALQPVFVNKKSEQDLKKLAPIFIPILHTIEFGLIFILIPYGFCHPNIIQSGFSPNLCFAHDGGR